MSRIGGWAGIGAAVTYLVGFALAGTLLADTVGMETREYVRQRRPARPRQGIRPAASGSPPVSVGSAGAAPAAVRR